jgi:hypothetical protein
MAGAGYGGGGGVLVVMMMTMLMTILCVFYFTRTLWLLNMIGATSKKNIANIERRYF